MAFYRRVGDLPPKRHTQHRRPDGGLYAEELMGEEGFSSDSALLYHRGIPSAIVDARRWDIAGLATAANEPLRPRHLVLHNLVDGNEWKRLDPVTGRRLVLGNADVRISYAVAGETSPYYRNALGDECVYVESGRAVLETVFGAMAVGEGDYVIVPRSTTHRWVPETSEPIRLYAIEANSHITPPRRYLSKFGQLLEHAPYCERDLRGPMEPLKSSSSTEHPGAGSPGRYTLTRPIRSMSSAGTAACIPLFSTFLTSSRSRAGFISRRRRTRSSRAATSSSATSFRARSTTTRSRSRCRTTTPTSTATR
jgi:homogentisate 1,2-dioxygenase